jgi:alpha-galactosidase
LAKTVEMIRDAGMLPGIWFEFENCGPLSKAYQTTDHLLKRNGNVITVGSRRFWDMNDPWVIDYLNEKVIALLKKYGFRYIKVDYNETIGVGCDGRESLGEGLRQNILATRDYFRKIREDIPGIIIENCSSGGHRLEPSMMALCDMASFSDAHECDEIPVIAANLHRLILPAQTQIWAVLRKKDSMKRLTYSLVNTLLGVMCLSGDIYDLDDAQLTKVTETITFYKKVSHIIKNGFSSFYGTPIKSYRKLEGWQAVVRYNEETMEILVIIHTFGGTLPFKVCIPVQANKILAIIQSGQNEIFLENTTLTVEIKENFEAMAVYCR